MVDVHGETHTKYIDLLPPAGDYFFTTKKLSVTVYYKKCDYENQKSFVKIVPPTPGGGTYTYTLLNAPAGYNPNQSLAGGMEMIKLNEPIQAPSEINPFYYNPATMTSPAYGVGFDFSVLGTLPPGDYQFKIEDSCAPGRSVIFTVKIEYKKKLIQAHPLKIVIEPSDKCGMKRIYPFREGLNYYVTDESGTPQNFRLSGSGISKTVTVAEITAVTPLKDWYFEIPAASQQQTITIEAINQFDTYPYTGSSFNPEPYVNLILGTPYNYGGTGSYCPINVQTFTFPPLTLSYNRNTYYAYKCADGSSATMGIEGINGVGPYNYILKDLVTNEVISTKTNVPKGTLAHFTIPKPTDGSIAKTYSMTIQDAGCVGSEVYETVEMYELSATSIHNYTRKVCVDTDTDITPINGVNGIVAEGMHYDWVVTENLGGVIGIEPGTNLTKIMSGNLSLPAGTVTPKVVKLEVTPTYGSCPGKPFIITLVVSPCINYWQGGTDNEWNKTTNWTEYKVPLNDEDVIFATEANNPTFEGIPTSGPAVRDLHVPVNDPKSIGNLVNETNLATVIPAEASLTITKEITGSGKTEEAHKLIVGAAEDKVNGTLIVTTGCDQNPIFGTVQLYAKGQKGTKEGWEDNIDGSPTKGITFQSEYHWQYFGVPVESIVAYPTFNGSKIRMYDETYNGDQSQFYEKWHTMSTYSTLGAFKGYSITQESPKTYSIAGKLQFCDTTLIMTRRAPAVRDATGLQQNVHYALGQNLFGNSFTAAINIDNLTFPDDVESVVYLYNTGRFHDWATNGELVTDNTQRSAGNWFSIPKNSASAVWDNQIPSLQGFMLKFKDDKAIFDAPDESIILKYSDGGTMTNKRPQLVPEVGLKPTDKALSFLRINLESASTRDALWLISQEGTTNRFDNGWDGHKYFGTPTAFIFTENKDGLMQVNADESIDGSILSFYANADTEYELTLIKSNLDQYNDLHLIDLLTRTATSLENDTTTYRFTALNAGKVENRFIIVNNGNVDLSRNFSMLDAYMIGSNRLVVNNLTGKEGKVSLHDTTGRTLFMRDMPIGSTEYSVQLSKGVYIVNMAIEGKRESVKIVVE